MKYLISILAFILFSCCASNVISQEMRFFKKKSKFNLQKLLEGTNETAIIMAIDVYLNKKSNYGEKMEGLSESQKKFLIIENLEREINNGGFNQFYFNSSGDYSNETVNALITIKAHKTAEIVKLANAQFFDSSVPKDRFERQKIVETIDGSTADIWEKCDQDFYKYEDNIEVLLIEFVKTNSMDFEK